MTLHHVVVSVTIM